MVVSVGANTCRSAGSIGLVDRENVEKSLSRKIHSGSWGAARGSQGFQKQDVGPVDPDGAIDAPRAPWDTLTPRYLMISLFLLSCHVTRHVYHLVPAARGVFTLSYTSLDPSRSSWDRCLSKVSE